MAVQLALGLLTAFLRPSSPYRGVSEPHALPHPHCSSHEG